MISPGTGQPSRSARSDWMSTAPTSDAGQGLGRSLDVVRAHRWFVAAVVVAAVATALIVLSTISKEYQAKATLLVEPVSNNDPTLFGLGLPHQSSDSTRDVETMAQLIATPAIAARVRRDMDLSLSTRALLRDVQVVPVAQSNVVALTATAKSADGAAALANGFVTAAIEERTARLHSLLHLLIPRVQAQLAGLKANEQLAAQSLATQLQELKTLRGRPDPTLQLASSAQPPTSPISPHRALTVVAAALGGLIAGIGLLLGSEALVPSIQREEDLRRYRLPILARVPTDRRRRRRRSEPLIPGRSTFGVGEAYQLLATAVAASRAPKGADGRGRVVVVTGANRGAGKTTTALHLAAALGQLTSRVLVLDADTRHPQLANLLGITPTKGLETVIDGRAPVSVASDLAPFGVRVLLQERAEASTAPVFTAERAARLFALSSAAVDWVVCDAPPPVYVSDGLVLAKEGDVVIVVVRQGWTRARELAELAEMFAQQGITPLGLVLIGSKRPQPYLSDTSRTSPRSDGQRTIDAAVS